MSLHKNWFNSMLTVLVSGSKPKSCGTKSSHALIFINLFLHHKKEKSKRKAKRDNRQNLKTGRSIAGVSYRRVTNHWYCGWRKIGLTTSNSTAFVTFPEYYRLWGWVLRPQPSLSVPTGKQDCLFIRQLLILELVVPLM